MADHDRHLCESCLNAEYEEFEHSCVHESMAKNDVWLEHYKINDLPRWDYSDRESTLTFSKDGKPVVICDIQIVGSTEGNSWQWCWSNQKYPLEERQRMEAVRNFGEEKGWVQLTSPFLENSDEHLGWQCTSVANHILDGTGTYRWPANDKADGDFFYVVILTSRFVN